MRKFSFSTRPESTQLRQLKYWSRTAEWRISAVCGVLLQDLRSKLSRAECILKLSGMCRKLETEQEKVLPFHTLTEAVPVPEQPHLAEFEREQHTQHDDQHEQQDQQQLVQGMQDLQVILPQQQQQYGQGPEQGQSSQPTSPVPGLQQQQQQWTAVGLDDSGQPVSDWDYLNK